MQEVTSQESAADLVSKAPAKEHSCQTDMQEAQWEQDQWASAPIHCLYYLPPLSQGLLQIHDLCLAAAELHLQLLTGLWAGKWAIRDLNPSTKGMNRADWENHNEDLCSKYFLELEVRLVRSTFGRWQQIRTLASLSASRDPPVCSCRRA